MTSNHTRAGQWSKFIDPIGRLLVASLFLASAFDQLTHWHVTTQLMTAHAMPMAPLFLSAAVVIEVGGSLGLIFGYRPRASALALAGFTLIATSIFHSNFSDETEMHLFGKDIAVVGALLCLAVRGAGPLSIKGSAHDLDI